jgi:hypothetical protein
MDAAAFPGQTGDMDETERHETIVKVTDRLAARYPTHPGP